MAPSPALRQPAERPELAGPRAARRGEPAKLRWITVWVRAVVVPAARRAGAAWLGCAIVAAVLFGPTAMRPSDLTGLALHDPGVGAVLAATWLLVFVPTARMIVRPPAAYLASLPGAPRAARAIAALALVGLQLPWLVLWVAGEGALGAVIVAATAVVVAALASVPAPRLGHGVPAWRRPGPALVAVHLRALARRAGDALVRGAGLAVLAGIAAGLLVRNNQLTGQAAGVFGASIIAIVLVPAQIGAALATLGAYRETAWLAASTGIAPATRLGALVVVTAAVHLASAALASGAAMAIAGPSPWLAAIALGTALGTALGEARTILGTGPVQNAAARIVIGAIATAALAVVCLTLLDAAGSLATVAVSGAALALVRR